MAWHDRTQLEAFTSAFGVKGYTDYDELLARSPQTIVAAEERAAALELREASTPKNEVTKTARKPSRSKEAEAKPEPPKPPGRWQRFKKWFRGT